MDIFTMTAPFSRSFGTAFLPTGLAAVWCPIGLLKAFTLVYSRALWQCGVAKQAYLVWKRHRDSTARRPNRFFYTHIFQCTITNNRELSIGREMPRFKDNEGEKISSWSLFNGDLILGRRIVARLLPDLFPNTESRLFTRKRHFF